MDPARRPPWKGAEPRIFFVPALAYADDPGTVVVEAPRAPVATTTSSSVTDLPLGPDLPPGEDLAAVVEGASGTVVRRLGGLGDFSAVRIRGSTFQQVDVYLDGVPLNPDGSDTVDLSELPVAAFDKVRLYRGNAPVRYATAAMGGVLDLLTPHGALPTSVQAAGGSFGTLQLSAVGGPAVGPVETFVAVDGFHTDGDYAYFDDQGTEYNLLDDRTPIRANNDLTRGSVLARVRWTDGVGDGLELFDAGLRSARGLPGPTSAPADDTRYGVTRNLLVASGNRWFGCLANLEGRGWWTWRRDDYDDRGGELGTGADWTTDTYDTAGGQLGAQLYPWPWLQADVVARVHDDVHQGHDLLLDVDGTRHERLAWTGAVSATASAWDRRLVVEPVLQVDGVADDVYVLPRGGVLGRPWSWLTLKANVGLYARAPELTELYGDRGAIEGNPDLVPEHGFGLDAGLRVDLPRNAWLVGSFDASYARNLSDDLVVWVQNSQYTVRPVNVGKAYVRTVEGALDLELRSVLRSQTTVTWMLSRNLVDDPAYANNALPGLPELELSQATTLHWRDVVSLTHTWSWTSGTWLDTVEQSQTAPRDLHALSLAVKPSPKLPTLAASVLNLLDVRGMAVDRDPVSSTDNTLVVKPLSDFFGYPLPGRTLMVSVAWTD